MTFIAQQKCQPTKPNPAQADSPSHHSTPCLEMKINNVIKYLQVTIWWDWMTHTYFGVERFSIWDLTCLYILGRIPVYILVSINMTEVLTWSWHYIWCWTLQTVKTCQQSNTQCPRFFDTIHMYLGC